MTPRHRDDSESMAAFRFQINKLENLVIGIYFEDKDNYRAIRKILMEAANRLTSMKKQATATAECQDDSDCDPGYVCVNGRCEPDFALSAAARQTPSS